MASREDKLCRWKFEAQPDYFFDYVGAASSQAAFRASTLPSLGLLEHSFSSGQSTEASQKPWQRFAAHVESLNAQAPAGLRYKVIYITRHGLGYHNVFEAQVGREAWNTKWSHLDGDGDITWADSRLNEAGIEQARSLGRFWSTAMEQEALPAPESIYTSPLARCLETTKLVFQDSVTAQGRVFRPVIKEALRERITDHTCDRRSDRSWIVQHYPEYVVEPGLPERDPLWTGEHWETAEEHEARKQELLEDIFDHDPHTFVSLTTHSYAVSAILGAVGLPQFRVGEGSSIALFVKGERVAPTAA